MYVKETNIQYLFVCQYQISLRKIDRLFGNSLFANNILSCILPLQSPLYRMLKHSQMHTLCSVHPRSYLTSNNNCHIVIRVQFSLSILFSYNAFELLTADKGLPKLGNNAAMNLNSLKYLSSIKLLNCNMVQYII